MSLLYTQTIVIVRPGILADEYGNNKPDWAGAARTTVSGVNAQPHGGSAEDTEDKQVTVTGWRLFTPRGMDLDLRETDRVEMAGMTLQVTGKVARWPAPGGGVHHIEADLQEVS
ncbi:hypothetical protein AB0D49_08180 [Streptomyces sp. NPDC048290]|uniref:hypothetical protein n=1 Tax=Streptomyces sp. NPDC048290 TaxID=3155811 RepID=UPI00341CEF08